jgi:cell wall assembly regulator SMI1
MLAERDLNALAARWEEQRAPVLTKLRPGLSGDAIDRASAACGLTLPTEARTWWGWHDGTNTTTATYAIGLDLLYLPLEKALAVYKRQLNVTQRVANGDDSLAPEDVWPENWLPLSVKGNGAMMVCDCGVPDGAPTPIRHVDHEFFNEARHPVARSFGTVVSWWIDALDRGAWTYNADLRRWEEDPSRLADPSLARTHLV